jgi:hypothetical protein
MESAPVAVELERGRTHGRRAAGDGQLSRRAEHQAVGLQTHSAGERRGKGVFADRIDRRHCDGGLDE